MRLCISTVLLAGLLTVACESQPSSDGPSFDDSTDGSEACEPGRPAVPETYTISLVGFPEVEGDELLTDMLQFEGPCVLDEMAHAQGQLTLSLSCEHPTPSVAEGASVTITTAAAGLPAEVEVGDTLTFRVFAIYFDATNGDGNGPVFRALSRADRESYSLRDADGPVFAAAVNNLHATFEPIEVRQQYSCPEAEHDPCLGNVGSDDLFVRATVGGTEVDVHVGEVGLLESGELAWDLSLFEARLAAACGEDDESSFSIVRRPG